MQIDIQSGNFSRLNVSGALIIPHGLHPSIVKNIGGKALPNQHQKGITSTYSYRWFSWKRKALIHNLDKSQAYYLLAKSNTSFHWTTSVSVSENDTFPVYINSLELLSEANNLIPRKVYITLSSSCNMRQLALVIELSNMFNILLCQHTVIELSLKRNKTYITCWPAALIQYRWHFEKLSFMPLYQHVKCSHRLICYAVKVEQWSSNIEDFLVPRTTYSMVAEQVIIRF